MSGRWKSWVLIILLGLILALPFLVRGWLPRDQAPPSSAPPARRLIVISPHWEGIRQECARAFQDWSRARLGRAWGIDWLDVGGTSDAIRYVESEFSRNPAGIGVDLFFGGGTDPYLKLSRSGHLAPVPLPPAVLGPIPPRVAGVDTYGAGRDWFGACLSGFGIIYNKPVLARLGLEPPRTWSDLADPRFEGWVGSADPRNSGSVHMAYEIMFQRLDWPDAWSTVIRLGGNVRAFSRGGSDTPKDVALGEAALGLAIDVYAWKEVARCGADRIGFVMPPGDTLINPDGLAVLKGAPHAAAARAFVEFMLGETGQNLWVLPAGVPGGPKVHDLARIPVRLDLLARAGDRSAVRFSPEQWTGTFTYDQELGSRRWSVLNDLLGAALIDTHPELVRAWKAVIRRGLPADQVARLTAPPVGEAEAQRLSAGPWDDPGTRARIRTQWTETCRARYQALAKSEKAGGRP